MSEEENLFYKPEDRIEMFDSKVINANYLAALDMHMLAGSDEFIEICIFPLNNKYEIARTITPFYASVKPRVSPYHLNLKKDLEYRQKFGVTERAYTKAYNSGIDRTSLVDLFEEWMRSKFRIIEGKRVSIICYDWFPKQWYLIEWLGQLNFNDLFSYQVRDIRSIAVYHNDWASFNSDKVPFTGLEVSNILSTLGIRDSSKDTIVRASGIAEAYKTLVNKMLGTRF